MPSMHWHAEGNCTALATAIGKKVWNLMQTAVNSPFLKELTREQHDLLSPLFEPFHVSVGTMIFKQGDEAEHLYLILRGAVTIQYKPYDGPIITLSHLNAGDLFGWSSVIGGDTYTSDALSITDVDLLRIHGADLMHLCTENPTIGCSILEKLAEVVSPRWMNSREQVHDLLQGKARQLR